MRRLMALALACALVAPVSAVAQQTTAQQSAAQQSAATRVAAYRERVERLEDADQVENLQAYFGFFFDKGMWAEAADLFSARGTFEYGQRGVYVGKDRIRRSLLLFAPERLGSGYLNTHMMLQPIITVADDGRTATGRLQGMMQLAQPGMNGIWGVGIWENALVKEGGVWKISAAHFYVTAITDYDLGFMKSALRMDGPSALFPPDRPPTEVYRSFPSAYIPPFSFTHPVTGASLKDIPQPADNVVGRK